MNEIAFRSPKNVLIDTVGKWRELAPREWGRGRPLTELAERWLTSGVPEIDALLSSRPSTSGFVVEEGRVRLPDLDLIVAGPSNGGRTLLTALPLADDLLGPTIDEAVLQRERSSFAQAPLIERMVQTVFGVPSIVVGTLRLRLLTATAALLDEAKKRSCAQAVLVFHELRSPLSPRQIAATHAAEVNAFVRRLSLDTVTSVAPNLLWGPLPGSFGPALFVGKVVVTR